MNKITICLCALFLATGSVFGQQPGKKLAHPKQLNVSTSYDSKFKQLMQDDSHFLEAQKQAPKEITPSKAYNPLGVKMNPVTLGRASNGYTILRTEQNQLWASDSLNTVAFMHRQDVTIFGGGGTQNGKYRYDLSTDGGATFSNDIGAMQTAYTNYGRYPNVCGFRPTNSLNPFDAKIAWMGPTNKFPTPGWIGHVYGVSDVTTGSSTSSENYLFDATTTLLPGALCQGLDGEFWTVEFGWDGTNLLDSIVIYKGTWNQATQDLDWVKHHSLFLGSNINFDGAVHGVGPNIAFSPDGQTGWVGILGDLVSGHDSVYSPVFSKSTDGGATWGTPVEVDLRTFPWIKDSLQTLWIDSVGNPASTGRPTCSFDYDLTVDANGNPHLFTSLGSGTSSTAPDPGYTIFSGLTMFGCDISSTDGGTTWTAGYVAPILSFRGSFGTPDPDGDLLDMDNYPQISRNESGTRIFYSWVDSDTTITGFGVSDNLAPNLRVAGLRITDGFRTCFKMISDGDLLWDGKVLYPTMAPTVLTKGNSYHCPISFMEMISNDQQMPCRFHYVGNDAVFTESDFVDPATLDLTWTGPCYGAFVSVISQELPENIKLYASYPNPASNSATIRFDLTQTDEVELVVTTLYGQSMGTIVQRRLDAGTHEFTVNTSSFAPGVYLYTLKTRNESITNKMVIVK